MPSPRCCGRTFGPASRSSPPARKTRLRGTTGFLTTRANGRPGVATYLRQPGEAAFRPVALEVLRIEGDRVAEIVDFDLPREHVVRVRARRRVLIDRNRTRDGSLCVASLAPGATLAYQRAW